MITIVAMPVDKCVVCGNSQGKDRSVSMHRFPRDSTRRKQWLKALKVDENDVKDHHRVCSRHFANADASNTPDLALGKRFASPTKAWTSRAKRAKLHEVATRQLSSPISHPSSASVSPSVRSTLSFDETDPTLPLVSAAAAVEEEIDPDCGLACTDGNMPASSCTTLPVSSSSLATKQDEMLVNSVPYSGKFSEGSNFQIIRKLPQCPKI